MSAVNRTLAYLTAAALCLPVGHAGLRAWRTLAGGLSPQGPAAATAAAVAREATPAAGPPVERIAEWNLFGRADAPAVVQAAPVEAPKTRLQLTLRGVAASPAAGEARAIIADPSGRERQYRPGEAVPGGASLAEVHEDRVLLLRNGRYETLPLAKVEGAAASDPSAGLLGPLAGRRRGQPPGAMPAPPPAPPEAVQPEPIELPEPNEEEAQL